MSLLGGTSSTGTRSLSSSKPSSGQAAKPLFHVSLREFEDSPRPPGASLRFHLLADPSAEDGGALRRDPFSKPSPRGGKAPRAGCPRHLVPGSRELSQVD